MRAPNRAGQGLDPTIYPVREKVGESILQRRIMELLRPLVDRWLRQRGVTALVGADQFIYYRQHAPHDRVAPDLYVLPDVPPEAPVTVWKTWETGIAPSFSLEIVSRDWEKDYVDALERYPAVGVSELVIFDPEAERRPRGDGLRWQLFRRVKGRPLARVEAGQGDRVKSKVLGCHLRAVGTGDGLRLRLGTGPHGDELFPTGEEAERAAKEAAVATRDAALATRDAALARVAELEAQLRRRRSRAR